MVELDGAQSEDGLLDDGPIAAVVDRSDLEGAGAGTAVVSLTGEIDIASIPDVQDGIDEIIDRRDPHTVVFDLSELQFMDSSGLALLLGVAVHIETVQVRNPSAIVRRVIELSGLAEALPMTP